MRTIALGSVLVMLDDQARLIYFWEIRSRIENALRAWAEAEDALRNRSVDDFWYHVDGFLNSSNAVCNLLWPSQTKAVTRDRAKELRTALSATDEAPAGLREVRNGFEHFDERIDRWRTTSAHRVFVDTHIGSPSSIRDVDPSDIARLYNPEGGELKVFGKVTAVPAVLSELRALRSATPERY